MIRRERNPAFGCRRADMKLATFTQGGRTRIGIVDGEEISDLSHEPALPTDLIGLLVTGPSGLERARAAQKTSKSRFPLSSVRLEAPVMNPRKFLGLGGSYRSHLDEVAR